MIRIYTRGMYVCLCQGVTDQDIVAAVEAGASSLGDLQKQLGAATGCGACREYTERLLGSTLSQVLPHQEGTNGLTARDLGYAAA